MAIAANRSVAIERVGIVGAGAAAAVHLRAVQRLPGKRVVAIHDIDPRRAAALASEFGLPRSVVMDRQRLYENGRPQLVHVVTPPHVHQDIGLEALARGVHVFVEKPRNSRLIRASLGVLCQIVANTAGLLTGHRERYGSSLHSIRAHYAALETGQEIPAPLSRGVETVEVIRTIWPA